MWRLHERVCLQGAYRSLTGARGVGGAAAADCLRRDTLTLRAGISRRQPPGGLAGVRSGDLRSQSGLVVTRRLQRDQPVEDQIVRSWRGVAKRDLGFGSRRARLAAPAVATTCLRGRCQNVTPNSVHGSCHTVLTLIVGLIGYWACGV